MMSIRYNCICYYVLSVTCGIQDSYINKTAHNDQYNWNIAKVMFNFLTLIPQVEI
jgi:hypothetical protein